MARQCMLRREARRTLLAKKYAEVRTELKAVMKDPNVDTEEKFKAMASFRSLPKDSSLTRHRNRCWQTGRGNGVYRIVGLCRNKFRELCMNGYIPGMRKASW
jgi:small subunit ribosomal protein S14